jgi:hypothetical protein
MSLGGVCRMFSEDELMELLHALDPVYYTNMSYINNRMKREKQTDTFLFEMNRILCVQEKKKEVQP